jgi:ArsR family transcriptional regulator
MILNAKLSTLSTSIAEILGQISSPARVALLLTIGEGEACVCHLESVLGWRQAYISQHLMALRKAGILKDRREGRYVYYQLVNPIVFSLIKETACLCGLSVQAVSTPLTETTACSCPQCAFINPA